VLGANKALRGGKRLSKALVLMSGGLDSILAAKVLMEQGVEVEAVTFVTPFFDSKNGEKAAAVLGIPIHIIDITAEHMVMLKDPKHGYGRFMNPCIDCHAMMMHRAGDLMREVGADFLATGEVLGERPKSQNRKALDIVEEESGMAGYVLRPLSAKLLEPTIPEKEGLVDREKLLSIRGRSRKPQMALAERYGITDYPSPAGGCILTDTMYSLRLRKLYELAGVPSAKEARLLKIGRFFLSSESMVIIVSRKEEENEILLELAQDGDYIFEVQNYPGPLVTVLSGSPGEPTIFEAAALAARYSKAKTESVAEVAMWRYKTLENRETGVEDEILSARQAERLIRVENPGEAVEVIPGDEKELPRINPR
jgi:tRNA U34 2-thiouridine synthase MnmA/TrmU